MSQPVRIPSDVDREDRVIGQLTARQLLILTVTGIVLYGTYSATKQWVPLLLFLAIAIPIGITAAFLALGQRDGITMDKLALAALRQRLGSRHQVAAPEGIRPVPDWVTSRVASSGGSDSPLAISPAALRLPAEAVTDTGVIDLEVDGMAVVAVCSTVNFALRTPAEQESLVASFGRYLHSLTAPVQVLVRAERLDLSGQIAELREHAGGLPDPALEAAAREHADYLEQLGRATDLLRRQVLLVLREPVRAAGVTDGLGGAPLLARLTARRKAAKQHGAVDEAARRAAEARLARRLGEAIDLLSPAGIVVTPLDSSQATSVLASACNPDSLIPPNAGLAGADDVITTAPDDEWDDSTVGSADEADDWDDDVDQRSGS
ncbi:PrgI family protein [Umezawaea sp. NPDC059074]|uniref:PrgI family protein n=1 Tax=Umezawaea sp. NPDC059074 TaxID=3346716 RepID=UPI00369CE7EB